jgi:hypothetical protein
VRTRGGRSTSGRRRPIAQHQNGMSAKLGFARQTDRASDRCAADASGLGETRGARPGRGCRAASELSQGRQARGDHDRALHPCTSVQAHAARAEVPAHPLGPRHPRYPRQDCRRCPASDALQSAARSRGQGERPGITASAARRFIRSTRPSRSIAKGKARAPYEFGCRVSVATPVTSPISRPSYQGRAPQDRNYLKRREGDRINAVLAAAGYTGYNFSLLLRWLAELLRALIVMLELGPGEPRNA